MKVFVDTCLLIYLNALADVHARSAYENFYLDLVSRYKVFVDVLVLDELIYISEKKYGVPSSVTLNFIDSVVLPYADILSLGEEEFKQACHFIKKYGLRPSDALHSGAMKTSGIEIVASENSDFDKVEEVKRIWLG